MTFKIDHANLNVFDLQRSIDFYEKALGLRVVSKNQPEHGEFIRTSAAFGYGMHLLREPRHGIILY